MWKYYHEQRQNMINFIKLDYKFNAFYKNICYDDKTNVRERKRCNKMEDLSEVQTGV